MTTLDRNLVLIALIVTSLVAVAAAFTQAAGSPGPGLFPVVILLELVVYFIAFMVMNGRATVGMAAGSALSLVVLRAICSLFGGILADLAAGSATIQFASAWLHPAAAIIQGVVLLFSGPFLLATLFPDLVGRREAAELLGASKTGRSTSGNASEATPAGGFIQVFTFEELAALIKKSPGIEGFVLYSNEGLVVWRDLPLKLNTDTLTAKVLGANQSISATMDGHGLTKVRRVMVESRDHFLINTTLNQNFGIILLFNGRVAPEEIFARLGVLAKSAREFLQWKYPSLPMAAGASKENVPLEAV